MTLEDLNTVDLSAGCPPINMTDDQWQNYFNRMKPLVKPASAKFINCKHSPITVNGRRLDKQSSYAGDTQWYYYCQSINTMLNTIRHRGHDYCYNIYQITDLLKYEHDRLATKWSPEDRCIEVWLL